MKYLEAITNAMTWLGNQPKVIMLGQGVGHQIGGTFMSKTLDYVPAENKLELPVAESFQMQFSLGLAIKEYVPVSIYPRFNFLALAFGDVINVVDKMIDMSMGTYNPKIIIRTAIGLNSPVMNPQSQHTSDLTDSFWCGCDHIEVRNIEEPEQALEVYKEAYSEPGPYLVIERGTRYND